MENIRILSDEHRLTHCLQPFFADFRQFRSLKTFHRSALFREVREELNRVLNGMEWRNNFSAPIPGNMLRVCAWNIERGRNLAGVIRILQNDPLLSQSDILLLTETDIGMGRSGNHNVPRCIADALEMNYCFANSFLVLSKGDEGEQAHTAGNTLSLHGTSILSRYRITGCQAPALPFVNDCFTCFERRLGRRRGLICRLDIGGKALDVGAAHLDLKASPRQRARQLAAILSPLSGAGAPGGQIFGGDLNTHTYDLRNKVRLIQSFLYKLLCVGFRETITHYMFPDRFFEKRLFDTFRQHGFDYTAFNDLGVATLYFDLNEITLEIKSKNYVPERLFGMFRRWLAPWERGIPLRLDWLAGRGVAPAAQSGEAARVIDVPVSGEHRVSDHLPISVDIHW